ncbi:MAG: 50S ribosomal protein L7/L12, large subunit ribosomal protein L7/L12 [Candidatus Peregrinibacteria bacterium GW2011_GWF2_33_10]|nr:MAG: 50S ribosomal protein L7/L12, large subunit ribosomal protein L7/L12 [Candidatus Peregrinibacteria bacterium GW2011_GWF2_33_10]OGJ45328.1 MAG: 50S ribosomal protein L7/L12 [Candidatus Peregrinibacteria bacterium RIFOXYA12_FULL_33_12]OGJ45380.1 MAG: 50S ribosomal protein L7/L12 [Candidatus Peregrinibacteria bacterium RIFOXYA2_FULL_33_21]OGJ50983.1 MAG: 50S ribosomal protein L7/L12 [Candidatus Peregrinibacteria bacterium RIFOXYB2_FULL_33_20]
MSDTTIELSKEEKALIDALEKLNIVSLNNVVKYMEQVYGISAAAPVAVAAAPAAAGAAVPAAEEKSAYNVKIKNAGDKKIAVIKVVREVTQLGLGEAKTLVDSCGMVKENAPKAEAEDIKKKLQEAGAEVELL